MKVNIAGIDKAVLLAALYNNSRPMGMGSFQARPGIMTKESAEQAIKDGDDSTRMFHKNPKQGNLYFDYLYGRPLKISISGDEVEACGYDRDNGGEGAVAKIVSAILAKGEQHA